MKQRGLILLLLSGCVMVCYPQPDQLIRVFHYINVPMSWSNAQQYCRNSYTDLAIVNSTANILEAKKEVPGGEVWIGLFKNWAWSQTDQLLSSSFTNRVPSQPGFEGCMTISIFGSWTARPCSYAFLFICYSNVTRSYTLEYKAYTWSQAQSYCRNSYTDLSTITSLEDNSKNTAVLSPYLEAWIGLYRQDWVWSDWSKASNLTWAGGQPEDNSYCVTMDTSGFLHSHNCNELRPFLCYKDTDTKPRVSRSVKVRLTAGSADLNDPKVQESILQQMRKKLVDQGITKQVRLRWKKQPDGKVFHKEEEEACPSYRDCGTG